MNLQQGDLMRDFHFPGRSAVYAENGMCATSHPLAAKTALEILQRGGNAMDAAIAGAVLLGLCEPQMTGLGGDCFVLFSPAGSDEIRAMNGSGKSPQALQAQLLRDQGHKVIPQRGVEAITIPGAVDAFCTLSNDWGKLGLDALLAPSIHYAEVGIPVAPRVAYDWAGSVDVLQGSAKADYLLSGKAPQAGQKIAFPKQAEVLRAIAKNGRSGFYDGAVAEDILNTLTALGGVHSKEDFSDQIAFYTDPISGHYQGMDLVEHPPNGQGATAILLLNILSHFDLAALAPFSAERAHIEAEATKLAYDARNRFIADARMTDATAHLLAPETAEKLAALIDPNAVIQDVTAISETVHKDTVYITVVDKDRMSVSLIYSIFNTFGSGISSDKFGILMHNRGAGFNLIPGHPNELRGGHRPMHTIIPGMLCKGGKPVMPFGVMGGQYQANGHARVLTNMLDYGMAPQEALDAPRSFAELGHLKVERSYDPKEVQKLADIGHKIEQDIEPIGGAQAIMMHENGVLEGASDPRKDGCALGY